MIEGNLTRHYRSLLEANQRMISSLVCQENDKLCKIMVLKTLFEPIHVLQSNFYKRHYCPFTKVYKCRRQL